MYHYQVDLRETINGEGLPPSLIWVLIERLPDTSRTVALMLGGEKFMGWGVDRHMMADLYDLMVLNTQASGNWAKKPPKIPLWERPTSAAKKKPATAKSIMARLGIGALQK